MKERHVYALVGIMAAMGYVAYLAAPKHPMRIQELVIGGNTKIDSTWARLLSYDDKGPPIDWRAQTNTDPAKPRFVILLRSAFGTWQGAKPEAALVFDGRRIALNCRRAELVEGEAARSSFLRCTATLDELKALAEATDASLLIDGRRWSFGSSGPATFQELKRRADYAARD